jgi:hypothetical protein
MSSNPSRPGFTPGKPATYTPHSQTSKTTQAGSSQPAGSQDDSSDPRPSAPEKPDIPDRSNPPRPQNATIQETEAKDAKGTPFDEPDTFELGDEDSRGSDRLGEDRRSEGD